MLVKNRTPKNKTRVDLARIFEALDERSRTILWQYKYTQLSEMGSLTDSDNECEILSGMKEIINERAQEICGRTVVSFKESKNNHPAAGEDALYSGWLLNGNDTPVTGDDELLTEVFGDKERSTVISPWPNEDSQNHTWMDSKNKTPEVRVKDVRYKNGILQISLEKERR